MLEIFLLGFAIVTVLFIVISWLEGVANRNDEFLEVKEWHNFRNAFNKSNKGEK